MNTMSLLLAMAIGTFALTGQAAGTRLYSYLAESLQKSGQENFRDFATVVSMPYFRTTFPKAYGVPNLKDFWQQQLAEGVSEERIAQRYQLAMHIEPLTDEAIGAMLMQHPTLRAHIYAYSILYSINYPNEERGQEDMHKVAVGSRSLVPLIMAIDGDYSLQELVRRLVELMEHDFRIAFRQLPEEMANMNSGQVFNGHIGNYLFRSNFNTLTTTVEELEQALYDRGYEDYDFINMLPLWLANILANVEHQPLPIDSEARTIGELDWAIAVNLMAEKGVLGPGFVNLPQIVDSQAASHQKAQQMLLFELRGKQEGGDEFWQQVQAILNNTRKRGSLFQIKQLLNLDFPLDEIAALSYWARDAIIISDPASRNAFLRASQALLNTDGFDSKAINKIVADVGPLIFMLQQYDYELYDINPHQIDPMMEKYFSF